MSLAEDPRIRVALGPPGPLTTLEHHERVGSTNDVALARLRDGAAPGLVVVADRQTTGRGRGGRAWTDDLDGPSGPANLAVTATCTLPSRGAHLLPLAAGLAVVDAFAACGVATRLKWPNDVLLTDAERKAAGILAERHRVGAREVALIGCGLDVDWRGIERSGERAGWTSLAEAAGGSVDRVSVLASLVAGLQRWLIASDEDPDGLLAAYREVCVTLGRRVVVTRPGGGSLAGRATRLAEDGRLVLDTDGGAVTVSGGDVRHVRSGDAPG